MSILLTRAPAVKATCLSCGTELLQPELDGMLCMLCQEEVKTDMTAEEAHIQKLERDNQELIAACKSAYRAIDRLMVANACYQDHDVGAMAEGELAKRQLATTVHKVIARSPADSIPD